MEIFKSCPMCKHQWTTREEFLRDKKLQITGYSAGFTNLATGLFYFTHIEENCMSTMVLYASLFFDLYKGKHYPARLTGQKCCPGYCLRQDAVEPCKAHCECAFITHVIQIMNAMKQERR